MRRRAHNMTDSPVLIDAEGRTLGGGEWAEVDDDLNEVRLAAASGQIRLHDLPASPAKPPAGRRPDSASITTSEEA